VGKGGGERWGRTSSKTNLGGLMAYYLTTCLRLFRGRSRRPRPSLVNFEGSAMSWPGPGSPSPGAATHRYAGAARRCIHAWAVGSRAGTDHPASSRRPNRCDPAFFEKAMASLWAVPYERTSSCRLPATRCPVCDHTHTHTHSLTS
jgi:hypothetical protein